MDILFSIDNNYVMQAGVLMTSVSLNNDDVNYHIIVSADFSDENKTLLEKTATQFCNDIFFYRIDKSVESLFPMGKEGMSAYITTSTYYRLLAAEILPSDLHKILYLDSDIIVRKSLQTLWNTDVENFAVGVVRDMDEKKHIAEARLPYPMESGYFNAGVLLINLDYWRKHNVTRRLMDFIVSNSDVIRHHDQDVLNATLFNEKIWLPVTYNFQNGFLYDIPEMIQYSDFLLPEILKVQKDPAILHFTIQKPWEFNCVHPQRHVWFYYKSRSLWKDVDISFPLTVRERISLFLRKNNYWFFEHKPTSLHRNMYKRIILKK